MCDLDNQTSGKMYDRGYNVTMKLCKECHTTHHTPFANDVRPPCEEEGDLGMMDRPVRHRDGLVVFG